ncbi:MAG: UDP-glucose dehydrogenase family protein [Candidatus Bathyarchaeia archaeon]
MYTVLGLGYVGLVMAACLAELGFETVGVDVDRGKVELLNSGVSPIYEPELQGLVSRSVEAGLLMATVDLEEAVSGSEIVFITVGTPSLGDGSVDLGQVKFASESVGKAMKVLDRYILIVVRSTVLPGTCGGVVKPILENFSGKSCSGDFGLCVNPEFLREGSAVQDMLRPDRIIIGEYDEKSGLMLEAFYRRLYGEGTPRLVRTNLANAELIKYANNSFLATKISFINSIANLCELIPGGDVKVVAEGIGLDPRIGPLFLNAGLGWGGSCFPKDLGAILNFAKGLGVDLPIIEATVKVNDQQPLKAVNKAEEALGGLKGRSVAVLGLAFKPNTDDVRGSVAIKIIGRLLEKGAEVRVYDPAAMRNGRSLLGDTVTYAGSPLECIDGVDCCILATEWDDFKSLRPEDFKSRMRRPILIDGRRFYDAEKYLGQLDYYTVGLFQVKHESEH